MGEACLRPLLDWQQRPPRDLPGTKREGKGEHKVHPYGAIGMQVPLLTLPQAVPQQKMRPPQDNIPQERAERDYVARVVRQYVADQRPVPPMPMEQLKVHADRVIELAGL